MMLMINLRRSTPCVKDQRLQCYSLEQIMDHRLNSWVALLVTAISGLRYARRSMELRLVDGNDANCLSQYPLRKTDQT
jgi:hypothetical protein